MRVVTLLHRRLERVQVGVQGLGVSVGAKSGPFRRRSGGRRQHARVPIRWRLGLVPLAALLVAGCGSSGNNSPSYTRSASTTSTTTSAPAATTVATAPGALQAEANSAATGDIPDNQVFLVFKDPNAGWSMKYPEGWAQSGSAKTITFRDKNNIVRVAVGGGGTATVAAVRRDLAAVHGIRLQSSPRLLSLPEGRAVKVVYSTRSAPNSVTGKRVTLVVDRYYIGRRRKQAVVDLGTPRGVDNVDAYRLMIESFRWR